jgi:hypothetical protein
MRTLFQFVRISSSAILTLAVCAALSQQPTPRAAGKGEDPNLPTYENVQSGGPLLVRFQDPPDFPIWWSFEGQLACGLNKRPIAILFADDLTPGYYLGFNARGSWIMRESGRVVVFNGTIHTLSPGADSPAGAPGDLQFPPSLCGPEKPPRRERGMVVKGSDGSYTLSYTLVEEGKAPRPLSFKVAPDTKTGAPLGEWAWLGTPAQADPVAIGAITAEQRSQFQVTAPGQPIGSAALIDVSSAGSVQWNFEPQMLVADAMAHGEHGSVAKQPDGSYKLSYSLVEPGRSDQPMTFSVARVTLRVTPEMTRFFIAGGLCPAIDTANAWIWAGQGAQGPTAGIFNVSANGLVIWNFIPRDAALALLGGDAKPTSGEGAVKAAQGIPLAVKLVRSGYGGGVRMDNVYSQPLTAFTVSAPGQSFTVDSRTIGVAPIAPGGFWGEHTGVPYGGGEMAVAVAALFADGESFGQPGAIAIYIERRRAWIATLDDIRNRLGKFNTPQPDLAAASAAIKASETEQMRTAASAGSVNWGATKAAYQFVIECLDKKIRTLPGTLQAIEARRAQILADPIRVPDGSGHAITDPEVTAFVSALNASAAKSAEEGKNAPTVDEQLQARIPASASQSGPTPANPTPSSMPGLSLSTTHGTGAQVQNGILTYKDADSGAKMTFKVARPAFLTPQLQAGAKVGNIGAWVWVSDDGQQGKMFQIASDRTLTATVIPGAMARQFATGK